MHVQKKSPVVWFFIITAVLYFTHHTGLLVPPQHEDTVEYITGVLEGGFWQRQLVYSLLGVGGIIAVIRTPRKLRLNWHAMPAVLTIAFFSWSALSIAWSIDPQTSVRRYAVFLLFLLGALGAANRWPPLIILRFSVFAGTLNLVLSILYAALYEDLPILSPDFRFGGNLHPNPQGQACGLLFLACLGLAQEDHRRPNLLRMLIYLSFSCLILTKSRTAIAGTMFGLAAYWYLTVPRSKKWRLTFLIVLGILVVSLIGWEVSAGFLQMGRDPASTASLTGRIPLWEMCLQYVAQRPITGYGFDAFWTDEHIEDISSHLEWTISETHSGYLWVLVNLGIPGLVLYVVVFAAVVLSSHRRFLESNSRVTAVAIAWYSFISIVSILESVTFFSPSSHYFPVLALGISQIGARRSTSVGRK